MDDETIAEVVVAAFASSSPPNAEPAPALLSAHTPRAIRDVLVGAERAEFERRYAEEMAAAARTLDLTGVLTVLDTYRKIADITQRQGVGRQGVDPALIEAWCELGYVGD